MCGICGEYFFNPSQAAESRRLAAMQEAIRHRGPNDDGQFISGPCGLGFRRLSIIDLEGGHQPIQNEDGTIWVTLNGEIYNYPALRRELEERGHRFRSHSDTEVIVHLYEEHGADFCRHLRGMFGIALYDIRQQKLLLARDPLGIKPVYYWQDSEKLVYGSEIKALLKHPGVSATPNEAAIFQFLLLRHSLQPDTLFAGIHKLPAGTVMEVSAKGCTQQTYWQPKAPETLVSDPDEALARYEKALGEAVDSHLLADVPLGVFLSGGLDSSVIAALVQQRSAAPITCFTAGFDGSGDESPHAATVARHIGATHRRIGIRQPVPELLEELVWHLDEPIGDPACLPTYLLSQEAAKEVRVVLTGEGSDETNAGYAKYLRYHLFHDKAGVMKSAQMLWPLLRRLPPLKARFSHYEPLWNAPDELQRILANDQISLAGPGTPLHQLSPRLAEHRMATWAQLQKTLAGCGSRDPTLRLLHYSRAVFMQEDLLMKVDRMTMAHGLEARVPYLDQSLVELTAGFAPQVLLKDRKTKAVLRDHAAKLLPPAITQRKQHGFIVPLTDWFAGDFAAYAADLLSPENTRRRGLLDPGEVSGHLAAFQQTGEGSRLIWNLVLLELWFRRFIA
jgi:asparagine synthase (glutamine-hydrolysing)